MTHSELEQIVGKGGRFFRVRDGKPLKPKPYENPVGILLARGSGTGEFGYVNYFDEKYKGKKLKRKELELAEIYRRVNGVKIRKLTHARSNLNNLSIVPLHEGEILGLTELDISSLQNLATIIAPKNKVNAFSATISLPDDKQFNETVANYLITYTIQFYRI